MTVSVATRDVSYDGNGATTAFSVTFPFLEESHLVVVVTDADDVETVQTLGTHYTVTGEGESSGGTVTFLEAPAADTTVSITRTVPYTQLTTFALRGSPSLHEEAVDKLTMAVQQIEDDTQAALQELRDDIEADPDAESLDERTVVATGSDEPRTLADRFGESLNALDYGVLNNGSDQGAAINAVLDLLEADDGLSLYFPPGTYGTSVPLTLLNVERCRVYGAGPGTVFQPTAALAGLPVWRLTNVRMSTFEKFTVRGQAAVPRCAIESIEDGAVGGRVATLNTFRDLEIGSDGGAWLTDGIRFTCDGGPGAPDDVNNDLHTIERCTIYNIVADAISIEHNNALDIRITNTDCYDVGVGVHCANGSFVMEGGFILSDVADFHIGDGASWDSLHPCVIKGVSAENNNTSTAAPSLIIAGEDARVYLFGYERVGGNASTTTMVSITGDGVELTMSGCVLRYGQSNQKLIVTGDACRISITGSHLGLTHYTWGTAAGSLVLVGNTHEPGSVVESMDASGFLFQAGDHGGGYYANQARSEGVGSTFTTGTLVAEGGTIDGDVIISSATEHEFQIKQTGTLGSRTDPRFKMGRLNANLHSTPTFRIVAEDSVMAETAVLELNRLGYLKPAASLVMNAGDASGTPGNAIINHASGFAAVANGAQTCVVTCDKCLDSNAKIFINPRAVNGAAPHYKAVASAGSFTVTTYDKDGVAANVNATWAFGFLVVNV